MAVANLIKSGNGTQTLSGAGINFTNATFNAGSVILSNGVNITQTGSLTFGSSNVSLILTRGAAGSNIVSFGTFGTRASGATGNITLTDGSNGLDIGLKATLAPAGFVDQGTFFQGADYAAVDGSTFFVRAPIYGTDPNFSTPDNLAFGTNVLVTGADSTGSTTLNTVKMLGGGALNLSGQLSTLGVLKSGGGAATISGSTIVNPNAGSGATGDLVIRADAAGDTLTINSSILDNGGTTLVKAGNGVVVLGGANTVSGKTFIYGGSLSLANSLALQSSVLVFPASSGELTFSGISAATIGGLQNASGDAHPIVLQNTGAGAVALTIIYNGTTTTSTGTSFSGSGSFIKDGTGRLDLNGSSTFSGGVTLINGTLTANSINTLRHWNRRNRTGYRHHHSGWRRTPHNRCESQLRQRNRSHRQCGLYLQRCVQCDL